MENIKKCSLEEEKEVEAVCYCIECKIYLCNKCENIHEKLFKKYHHCQKLDKDINEIFTGLCKEEKHNEPLEYFCKIHNKLCCVSCICKIKGKGKGFHKDCDVCFIEDIKEEKKNKLQENIKNLENLSKSFEESVQELKKIFENVNENKEKLKVKIQKLFTKIRNCLNEREDELLYEVDRQFENEYFNDDIVKASEKLPNKIKKSIEKGKLLSKEWDNDINLISIINNCIEIENNIEDINKINNKMQKYNESKSLKIEVVTGNEENQILDSIKSFGKIFISGIAFNDSLIINNNNIYIESIIKWINSEKKINTKLLYRKSKDGDDYETFHRLCDNKGPTLILIKSSEGFIIGGYTPINWDNHSGWVKDDITFVFSLSQNKVYRKISKNYDSIWCTKNGPYFAEIGFRDKGKKNMSQGYFYYSKSLYFENFNEIIPNDGKDKFFDVEEVEIYNILFY